MGLINASEFQMIPVKVVFSIQLGRPIVPCRDEIHISNQFLVMQDKSVV